MPETHPNGAAATGCVRACCQELLGPPAREGQRLVSSSRLFPSKLNIITVVVKPPWLYPPPAEPMQLAASLTGRGMIYSQNGVREDVGAAGSFHLPPNHVPLPGRSHHAASDKLSHLVSSLTALGGAAPGTGSPGGAQTPLHMETVRHPICGMLSKSRHPKTTLVARTWARGASEAD